MRKQAIAACFRGSSFVCVRVLPMLLAGVMFLACGTQTQLQVKYVDAGQRANFDKLVSGLTALNYEDLIVETKTEKSISIVTDTARIQERSDQMVDDEATSLAFYSYSEKQIVMVEAGAWLKDPSGKSELSLTPEATEIVLAHEIGHALGLDHTDTGLMTPWISLGCVNRVPECLVEALKAEGKL